MARQPALEVKDLTVRYSTKEGPLTAVSNASFSVEQGEAFGLVGESGCGKSTLSRAIIGGLDNNGKITSGKILLNGEEIQDFSEDDYINDVRWKKIAWIPQASLDSLDPLVKVSEQAITLANHHSNLGKKEALDKIKQMFDIVGLPESRVYEYPHTFSGGMQQRALIALALFLEPDVLIADEPTTALDVIMQDQVFRYIDDIKEQLDTSILLITHDIGLVFESCEELAIMHSGQVAETGPASELYANPRHPYAILLQNSFPDIDNPDKELAKIDGHPPTLHGDVNFCTFAERCPWAVDDCKQASPPTEQVAGGGSSHRVACIREEEIQKQLQEETALPK